MKLKTFLKQNKWQVLQVREVSGLLARKRGSRREQHYQGLFRDFLLFTLVRYRKQRDRKFNFAGQKDFFQAVGVMLHQTDVDAGIAWTIVSQQGPEEFATTK